MIENLWIVVPVGKREKYLSKLLDSLKDYKKKIIFVNNQPGYTTYPDVLHIEDFSEINIYRWWNIGIKTAQNFGAKYVAVLNDDIEIDDMYISSIFNYLVTNNLAIVDTSNSGNGGGAAWIMDLSYGLYADERFRWWYGDTELFDRAKNINKFDKFYYAGFKHVEPNENLVTIAGLQEIVEQDRVAYERITNERNVS